MSLLQKLQGDNLERTCERHVEELHQLFVSWFQGTRPRDDLESELEQRLSPDFSHVAPNGQFLRGRQSLVGQLADKYACYKDRVFQIDIYAVQLLWHTEDQCLCTYEEWQSWQQAEDESQAGQMHQFGRLSTCLLERTDDGFRWVHVHETWLEAEAPEHPPKTKAMTSFDEDTIMTGPVEAARAPPPPPPVKKEAPPPPPPPKNLVVLVATEGTPDLPLAPKQVDNQNRVATILASLRVPYDECDGSDPEERGRRNELFGISKMWGKYPQFFTWHYEEEDIEYWGNVDKFFAAYEKKTLVQDLGVQPNDGSRPTVAVSSPWSPDKNEKDKVPEPEEDDDVPIPPPPLTVGADTQGGDTLQKRLIYLFCRHPQSREQLENQVKVLYALAQNNIPYSPVDGSEPGEKDMRDKLFLLSRLYNKYPQFFVEDMVTGDLTFWGEGDRLMSCNANGTLVQELGFGGAVVEDEGDDDEQDDDEQDDDYDPEEDEEESEESEDDEPEELDEADDDEPSEESEAAGEAEPGLIVLLSTQSLSREQLAVQERVTTILASKRIPYDEVDGSDPDQRSRRNQLFNISQQWGRYPQFFTVDDHGRTLFWGDREKFFESNEHGTLVDDLKSGPSPNGEAKSTSNGNVAAASATGAVVGATTAAVVSKATEDNGVANAAPDWAREVDNDAPPSSPPTQQSRSIPVVAPTPVESKKEESAVEVAPAPDIAKNAVEESEEGADAAFLEASHGILEFEEEDTEEPLVDDSVEEKTFSEDPSTPLSPIPQDTSKMRHVNPKIEKYAKPLMWEGTMVGLSIAGFDIGTSQGPIADQAWYKDVGGRLETMAQSRSIPKPRRSINLPEMVYPTAHVALEGHGVWLSWDATDALTQWAQAHHEIALKSTLENRGVSVLRSKDADLWAEKKVKLHGPPGASIFHYDWTFSTPFAGQVEGGHWNELDESGMRIELLTDQTVPILFFDEIVVFEDDLHDNGHSQLTVKVRVMPSCAYVLARLWVRVDNVVVRSRETRLLVDFFGLKPKIYRDVTWRECKWNEMADHGLPTDIRSWSIEGGETQEWNMLVQKLPVMDLPGDIYKHAVLEVDGNAGEEGGARLNL